MTTIAAREARAEIPRERGRLDQILNMRTGRAFFPLAFCFCLSGALTDAGIRCTCTAADELVAAADALVAVQAQIEMERADFERKLSVLRQRCAALNEEVNG